MAFNRMSFSSEPIPCSAECKNRSSTCKLINSDDYCDKYTAWKEKVAANKLKHSKTNNEYFGYLRGKSNVVR